jgi:ornithine cyclodeaminase
MAELPRIYKLQQIEEALEASKSFEQDLIDAVKNGFVAYSAGRFNAAPIQTMGAPPMAPYAICDNYAAQTCVKSGYITGDSHFVIKVASGGHPMKSNTGLLQVYSQSTGRLEALLLDEGILTEHRTAAAGAVAAELLAPKKIKKIGILGTSVQARYQLRYLKWITDCRNVLVWGRTARNAKTFQEEMSAEGWKVDIAEKADDLLEHCDLIVTVTSAREALLTAPSRKQHRKPQHISCIGADATGKMELDTQLVASADLLVADSKLQTVERGEFEAAIASGLVQIDNVVELGELIGSHRADLHRRQHDDNRLTIFDSSGVAVQDCAVAKLVSELLGNS